MTAKKTAKRAKKPITHVNKKIGGVPFTGVYRGKKAAATKFAKTLRKGTKTHKPHKVRVVPTSKTSSSYDVVINGVRDTNGRIMSYNAWVKRTQMWMARVQKAKHDLSTHNTRVYRTQLLRAKEGYLKAERAAHRNK